MEVTGAWLLVRPKRGGKRPRLPYTEKELIEGLTQKKAHADELPMLLPTEMTAKA